MEAKKTANGFLKAFKIIGTIVGVIGAAAAIAVGVATANPLAIAGGIALGLAATDSLLSSVSDGKISIAGLTTAIMGEDSKAAPWIAAGISLALNIAGIALTFGAASAMTGLTAVEKAEKVISTADSVISSIASIGTGAATIASGVYDSRITESYASTKDLDAILERIMLAMEMETDLLQSILEKVSKMVEGAVDIVEGTIETQTHIQTGGAPSMA